MNTTAIGDALEERIFSLLDAEIRADHFWAKQENCRLFRKKGYYSKDRESDIVFDISIEIYLPGEDDFSELVLVECKNYGRSVPVDDAEEFFLKTQQVAGAGVKAVIASTAAFQSGTLTFAKTKRMGLLRYFDTGNFKWELPRSPSASARRSNASSADSVHEGLFREDFESHVFDLFLQSPRRKTNSLWEFMQDLGLDAGLTAQEIAAICGPCSRFGNQVPYLQKSAIEARAKQVLSDIGYIEGLVDLHRIMSMERKECGLIVHFNVPRPDDVIPTALGRLLCRSKEIQLFTQDGASPGRNRFTLAHELGHHLLGHGRFMLSECCDESDFRGRVDPGAPSEVARMEFQANYFASCLLMPRKSLLAALPGIVGRLGIRDRGFGILYVDDQACNQAALGSVCRMLGTAYGVSRTAVELRLLDLGVLRRDVRAF